MSDHNIAFNYVKEKFAFLVGCGYQLTEADAPRTYFNYVQNYVLYYDSLYKLIEFALNTNGDNVECVIRNKVNGELPPYNDKENCLEVYMLNYLDANFDYDSLKVYSLGLEQRKVVITNYADILLKYKESICGDRWFDTVLMEHNRILYYAKKWNVEDFNKKISITDLLKNKTKFIKEEGYNLIEDSDLLPPYQNLGWHIIYGNASNTVIIKQVDWRDYYYLYEIKINQKTIFEGQAKDYKTLNDMADHFAYILKEAI